MFAGALIDALSRNNEALMEGETLYNIIKRPVAVNSSATQKPMYSDVRETGHDDGDFLFYRAGAKPKAPLPAATAKIQNQPVTADTKAAYELTFWNSIKDNKEPQAFQAYLDSYPTGKFVALAKIRIKKYSNKIRVSKPRVVVAASTPPRKVAPPPKSKIVLAKEETVLVVRAIPDQEYAPEFKDTKTYSTAIASLVQKYYSAQPMKLIVDEKVSGEIISEYENHLVSKDICQKYSANIIYAIELDMSRGIEEVVRTPDEAYISVFDCQTQKKVIKNFSLDFQHGETFTYSSAVESSISAFDRVSPLFP